MVVLEMTVYKKIDTIFNREKWQNCIQAELAASHAENGTACHAELFFIVAYPGYLLTHKNTVILCKFWHFHVGISTLLVFVEPFAIHHWKGCWLYF